MKRLVADTDVVSYIFKWHTSAPRYVELLEATPVSLFAHMSDTTAVSSVMAASRSAKFKRPSRSTGK
jgi:hypothetical protein